MLLQRELINLGIDFAWSFSWQAIVGSKTRSSGLPVSEKTQVLSG
jgi:hypothetical protein